jgi:hypothetical protein
VRTYGLSEGAVRRQSSLVESVEVESHEALALLVGDPQVAVDVDDVLKARSSSETVGATKRLHREPGQMVDVCRHPLFELHLEYRVGQDRVLEELLDAVKSFVTAGVLKQSLGVPISASMRPRRGTIPSSSTLIRGFRSTSAAPRLGPFGKGGNRRAAGCPARSGSRRRLLCPLAGPGQTRVRSCVTSRNRSFANCTSPRR